MNLNCTYKDIEWSECCFDKIEETICDADMIVPDAKSDIAKVIGVSAFVSIFSSEASSGRINISGEVKFNVLYIGDEENAKINSITKTAPFTHICACESCDGEILCSAEGRISNSSFSIVNSRRLKVSSAIALSVKAYSSSKKSALVLAEGAEVIEKHVSLPYMQIVARREISINETLDLPVGKSAVSSILRSRASVTSSEAKVLNNKLIIKGTVLISILYLSDSSVCDASIEMPFTEVTDCEGMSHELDADISVSVSSCDITPETDLSGDYKMLNTSIVLCCNIFASKTEDVSLITDAFLPHGKIKGKKESLTVCPISGSESEEEFVKENLKLQSLPSILRVFDLEAYVSELSIDNSGLISGFVNVSVLYISGDGSNPIASFNGRVPFSHKCASSPASVNAHVKHVSYSITSAEEIELRIDISFSLSSNSKEEIFFFSSLEEDDYTPPERASVIISFVDDNDTIWSVAKKHNISLSELTSANAIEDASAPLKKGSKLIIPR
jgi:hypothetical protein